MLLVFSLRLFGWSVLHLVGFVTQIVGCPEEFVGMHLQRGALFEESCDLAQKVFDRSCHGAAYIVGGSPRCALVITGDTGSRVRA